MNKEKLIKESYQMHKKCVLMLENTPQAMSNVAPILTVLAAINQLIDYLDSNK
jgi:hypothetical protein